MKKFPNLPLIDLMPFSEIDDKRPALLVTSGPAWNAVKDNLRGLNITATIEVTEATTEYWDNLQLPITNYQHEVVYAVGGGLTADAAKYFASKLNLPRWMRSLPPHQAFAKMDACTISRQKYPSASSLTLK